MAEALSQEALIGQLNPKIRGWSRYYRSVASKEVLNDCDYHLFPALLHGQNTDTRTNLPIGSRGNIGERWDKINGDLPLQRGYL